MKNYTITLTIGHNVNGRPMFSSDEICDFASAYLDIEAFTAFECAGMWRGERENSTRIEIASLDDGECKRIHSNVPLLAQVLNQQAIMCEIRPDRVEFVQKEVIAAQMTA